MLSGACDESGRQEEGYAGFCSGPLACATDAGDREVSDADGYW